MKTPNFICIAMVLFTFRVGVADDEGREVADVDNGRKIEFREDILPILRKNCLACHNKSETEGELILESTESLMEGGDSGPAVVAGNADESLIFQLASQRAEPFMPPVDNDVGAKPLSPSALGLLKLWIDQGAKADTAAIADEIDWKKVPDRYAPVYALDVSPDGRWVAAGRGNEAVIYSVVAKRDVQRLVDSSISETHPDSAHLDIVQSIAWSRDQQTVVTGGYRCLKVWQRRAGPHPEQPSAGTDADRELLGTDLGEVLSFTVTPDKTRLVAITANDSAIVAKLLELPSRNILKEITNDVFDADHLAAFERRVGLAKERLRVANSDVEAAKKRKEDDEKNATKSAEEIKKAEEDVPKRKEALTQAEEDAKPKQEAVAAVQQQVKEYKKSIDEIEQTLKTSEGEAKTKLTAELKQRQDGLKNSNDDLKLKAEELEKAQNATKKKRQEFEGAQKVVELAKEAKTRAEKAVVRRTEELAATEQEASKFEQIAKQKEELASSEKSKATAARQPLSAVTLLDNGWQFALRDASGRTARFTTETGDLLSVEQASATAPHDSNKADPGTSQGWHLVRTIGYPQDPSIFADRVTSLAFNSDDSILATGGGEPSRSGEVQIWNTADWTQINNITDAHSDVVYDVQFSPQNDMLASCGSDRMMKTIDPKTAKLVRTFEGHTGHVLGVTWRADGRTLETAGADKVVKVWDAKEGTQTKTVAGFKTEVTAVRFLGLEDRIVFSMGDGKVESRDSGGNGKPAFTGYSDYVHKVASSLDGKIVAAAGQDRVIRVWDAEGKLIVEFE